MAKPYKVSKRVKPGMLVTRWGGYLIPCDKGRKPAGVWVDWVQRGIIRPDGEYQNQVIPGGLAISGNVQVLAHAP